LSVLINVPYHYQEKWGEGILKNIAPIKEDFSAEDSPPTGIKAHPRPEKPSPLL